MTQPATKSERMAAHLDGLRDARERGLISPELHHIVQQLALLGWQGDAEAFGLVCLLSRWVNELEQGTGWQYAFRQVSGAGRVLSMAEYIEERRRG